MFPDRCKVTNHIHSARTVTEALTSTPTALQHHRLRSILPAANRTASSPIRCHCYTEAYFSAAHIFGRRLPRTSIRPAFFNIQHQDVAAITGIGIEPYEAVIHIPPIMTLKPELVPRHLFNGPVTRHLEVLVACISNTTCTPPRATEKNLGRCLSALLSSSSLLGKILSIRNSLELGEVNSNAMLLLMRA
jgi:hypothetical protein